MKTLLPFSKDSLTRMSLFASKPTRTFIRLIRDSICQVDGLFNRMNEGIRLKDVDMLLYLEEISLRFYCNWQKVEIDNGGEEIIDMSSYHEYVCLLCKFFNLEYYEDGEGWDYALRYRS